MTVELLRNLRTGATYARFVVRGHWDDRDVSVVGPFNGWTPGVDVLAPQPDGSRATVVPVADGADVHFRYLATGDDWFDDPEADHVDEHGSTVFWSPDGKPLAKKAPAKRASAKRAPAKKAAKPPI